VLTVHVRINLKYCFTDTVKSINDIESTMKDWYSVNSIVDSSSVDVILKYQLARKHAIHVCLRYTWAKDRAVTKDVLFTQWKTIAGNTHATSTEMKKRKGEYVIVISIEDVLNYVGKAWLLVKHVWLLIGKKIRKHLISVLKLRNI